MPENNFEKQVQQKLDDLTIMPSAEVWQKVAGTIEKRKGSRRIFAIVFLLVLFTGATIVILFNETRGRNINKQLAENNKHDKLYIDEKSSKKTSTQRITGSNITAKQDAEHPIATTRNNSLITKKVSSHPGNPVVKTSSAVKVNVLDKAISTDENFHSSEKDNYNTAPKVTTVITPAEIMDLPNEGIDDNNAMMAMPDKMILVLEGDVITTKDLLKTIDVDQLNKNEYPRSLLTHASTKGLTSLKQNNRWKMGFNFSVGATTTTQGYLGIIGTNSEELKNNDPLYSSIGSNAQSPPVVYYPSKIKAGVGFIAGVFVQKNLSQKINFSLGLNYKTYSSSMITGSRVDSNYNFDRFNFVYRAGTTNNYNNKFHFIELPVTLKYKLSKKNKLPLYLNMGMSLSQLISTNALQFRAASGLYYNDNSMFNKTQVNAMAGVLISINAHSKNPFLIGPDINLSLLKIADAGLYKNRRYSYIGIVMQKTIGKK